MAAPSSKSRVPPRGTHFVATSSMRCSTSRPAASESAVRCRHRRLVSEQRRGIVLASANPGKQREFAALFGDHGIELVLQSSLGIAAIAETGDTFEANAMLNVRRA